MTLRTYLHLSDQENFWKLYKTHRQGVVKQAQPCIAKWNKPYRGYFDNISENHMHTHKNTTYS